ncbi:hypothetical protein [Faecalispora sporosphaeroides]|uniref:Uncharacterized protein n=1 Tax=Faecalispora sporosphaeroides TaxID=1549 RepID=A0A928Q4H9_9FIRM|nr:hypothetical protein [Faecalispora sporosphaeroides]MBE6833986.1 hypothetical protein [Faecalispora sporosphaeroides]
MGEVSGFPGGDLLDRNGTHPLRMRPVSMQSFLFRTVHSLENRPVSQLRFPQRAVPVPIVDKQRGTADIAGGSPWASKRSSF